MIRTTLFTLLSLCLLIGRSATIEHVYTFKSPAIQENGEYQSVIFENSLQTALPGQPMMPYCQVKLLLPPGESALRIEISYDGKIELPGTFQLFPQQEVRPYSGESSKNLKKDLSLYSRNADYPANPDGKLVTSFMNGQAFAFSSFTPLRYNPVTGKICYFSKVNVKVYSGFEPKAQKALTNICFDRIKLNDFADNPASDIQYESLRLPQSGQYELLIICTSAFASNFGELISNYLKTGIRTQVMTLETISASMSGYDIPEKIRNYIIQEYQINNIEHVILAGDAELIPYRGLYCYVQSGSGYTDYNIPADLYYSALDGNWDTDGDHIWGEIGEEDLLPEISVGRLPFSNLDELNHLLHKSISYQFSPVDGEFRNILMAGEYLYGAPYLTWGSYYLELLIGNHSDNGYSTIGIPETYSFDKLYDETSTWSKQILMNHLNLGSPMFNHVGHSNQTYVMKMYNSDITNENFSGLNGITHNYPLVYSHGCLCASFDYNDCIAEKMVTIDNFASAFIGNSRYGWFNEGTSEGPSAHLHREFIDALYHDKYTRIGRAHTESKIASAPWVTAPGQWEQGALRWCFYGCNVLGDPAMAIYTDNPFSFELKYLTGVNSGTNTIEVQVSSNGLPLNGYSCAAIENGVLLGKSTTSNSGLSTIVLNPAVTDPDHLQIFVSGLNMVPQGFSAPKTYIWNVTTGNWNNPTSWSPARNNRAVSDYLIFDGNTQANPTVSLDLNVDENIGKLQITNNSSVTFLLSGSNPDLYIGHTDIAGPQLEVQQGSGLSFPGVNAIFFHLNDGCSASISGNINFNHAAHRLTGLGTNSINFNSGAVFTAGNTFTGNAFGTTAANSVVFSGGSHYLHQGGNAPFGMTAPASVVVFSPGSYYKFMAGSGVPEISGRTYANFEISTGSAQIENLIGSGNFSFQDIVLTSGNCGLNFSGEIELKGNISAAFGTSLSFDPSAPVTINLNGTSTQQISGEGNMFFGENVTLNCSNSTEVTLLKTISIRNLNINSGQFRVADVNSTEPTFDPALSAALQNKLDELIPKYSIKGISASVIYPSKGLWQGVSGISHQGVPIIKEMEFGIGSNTKLFTAVSLLKLAEQNIINLDDPLSKWLPAIPNVNPSITIRQILNHTSGVADFINYPGYMSIILSDPNRIFSPEELLPWIGTPLFLPGTSGNYSNSNYLLAGLVFQQASGQNIASFIRNNLLDPSGLSGTFFDVQERVSGTIAHPWQGGTDINYIPRVSMNSAAWTAGAIYSNSRDMALWYQAVFDNSLLKQSTIDLMTTFAGPGNYGLGIGMQVLGGRVVWGYGGDIKGYRSRMIYDTQTKAIICILTNTNPLDINAVAEELLMSLIENTQGN